MSTMTDLEKILNCLRAANVEGTIVDTIWMNDHQTLFDFIELCIEEAALAQLQEAEPVFENLMVGNATTLNDDDYPGLGEWWIQLRIGPTHDEVLARVYGNSVSEVRERAAAICNALHPPKPAAQPQVPEGYQLVPVAATMKIENAIAASRNLKASDIWEDALSAAKEEGE